jgi:hypothetical protein
MSGLFCYSACEFRRPCEHSDRRFAPSEHRLREAIQKLASKIWIASELTLLAMTAYVGHA